MSRYSREEVFEQIRRGAVIAVLTMEDADDAVPVARALLEGGVRVMELTLRTEAALDALRAISETVPDMVAGIGTVLTPGQLEQAKEAGADFAVSPGTNPRVIEAARDAELPFAPGVATPSDIEQALELECGLLKFFPAEPLGGLEYLNSVAAPYAHLGVQFVPLGGVGPKNLAEWLGCPHVAAVGGSWLAPPAAIAERNPDKIVQSAREAMEIAAAAKSASNI